MVIDFTQFRMLEESPIYEYLPEKLSKTKVQIRFYNLKFSEGKYDEIPNEVRWMFVHICSGYDFSTL